MGADLGRGGEAIGSGGASSGFGLSLLMLTRLPMDEIRFLTLAKVRPTTVRDFMMNQRRRP